MFKLRLRFIPIKNSQENSAGACTKSSWGGGADSKVVVISTELWVEFWDYVVSLVLDAVYEAGLHVFVIAYKNSLIIYLILFLKDVINLNWPRSLKDG